MKMLSPLLATVLLLNTLPMAFAEDAAKTPAKDAPETAVKDAPETTVKDAPETKVKETDWATITVPKAVTAGEKATAKIKIKGSAIKEDCELWANLSKFVGTTRKNNVAKVEPIALKAGADVEHEVALKVPADAGAVIFTFFTMPTGKTAWADKLLSTEVGTKVK